MNQNKPLPRPPSYYFRPIYNKKDIKCEDTKREEEKLLDPIKLLKYTFCNGWATENT